MPDSTPENPESLVSPPERPIQFHYRCPKCDHWTVSLDPNLETCPIPWDANGYSTLGAPPCGGDIGDWGPTVWWWMIPEDIQAEILRRQDQGTPESTASPHNM